MIQRVQKASVSIDARIKSSIGQGLLILLGIEDADDQTDIDWLVGKISQMRIFSDQEDKMNLSIQDIMGEVLVVSQFTLHASTKKGNRPSFIKAAKPEKAKELYEVFIDKLQTSIKKEVQSGTFGAMMDIELINSGPVTIILDTKNKE